MFLDLSKAFDTLDHNILLQKLERYGICGLVKDWFEDYLKNRKLVAKITTSPNKVTKSDVFDITYGAAQGSCLGLLLFIVFVNDIHHLPLYGNIILFADDTTILNCSKSKGYLKYIMEYDLQQLQSWFNANKLLLNISKMVSIKFWHDEGPLDITLNDEPIPMVNTTKFLGVYIDKTLSWHHHANHVIEKLNNNKQLLTMSKNLLNQQCHKNIYYGHIHSHLTYGLTVWCSMINASQMATLEKIQDQCVLLVIGKKNFATISTAYKTLSILQFKDLVKHKLCKLAHSIQYKSILLPLITLFSSHGRQKTHRYPTRNKNIPNVQHHHTQTFNRSFMCHSLMEYSKLPIYIKNEKSPKRFKILLKKYLGSN